MAADLMKKIKLHVKTSALVLQSIKGTVLVILAKNKKQL